MRRVLALCISSGVLALAEDFDLRRLNENDTNATNDTTTAAAVVGTNDTTTAAAVVGTNDTTTAAVVVDANATEAPTTTAAADPVTTTAAADPVTTTAAADPVTTKAADPVTTKAADPVTTAAADPVTTKAADPVTTGGNETEVTDAAGVDKGALTSSVATMTITPFIADIKALATGVCTLLVDATCTAGGVFTGADIAACKTGAAASNTASNAKFASLVCDSATAVGSGPKVCQKCQCDAKFTTCASRMRNRRRRLAGDDQAENTANLVIQAADANAFAALETKVDDATSGSVADALKAAAEADVKAVFSDADSFEALASALGVAAGADMDAVTAAVTTAGLNFTAFQATADAMIVVTPSKGVVTTAAPPSGTTAGAAVVSAAGALSMLVGFFLL